MGKERTLSPEALAILSQHNWPGNIRELVNVLENAIIMEKDDSISPASLPDYLQKKDNMSAGTVQVDGDYQTAKDHFDRVYYHNLIQQTDGNITQAARLANVSRQHFHLRMKQLELS